MSLNSEAVFSRLMLVTGAKTLSALSEALGYKYNWATTSKKREVIPYDACHLTAIKYDVSMDYLLYGTDKESNKIDFNSMRIAIAEGVFSAVQLEMIMLKKGVKVSTIANVITNELIDYCKIENSQTENSKNSKKAI